MCINIYSPYSFRDRYLQEQRTVAGETRNNIHLLRGNFVKKYFREIHMKNFPMITAIKLFDV